MILKEILAILKFKKIEIKEDTFLNKYFEDVDFISYKNNFLEECDNLPEEIIEKEILKIEAEIFKKWKLYREY